MIQYKKPLVFFAFFLFFLHARLLASDRTIDSLTKILAATTVDSSRIDLHAQLSNQLLATDYKASFKHAMSAVQLADKYSDFLRKVKAYRVAGAVCMYMGLNDLAVKYYTQYYELAESKKDKSEMGAAYFNLASVHLALNDFAKAKQVLMKAESLLQEGYRQKGEALPSNIVLMFRMNLVLIFQQLGELRRADSVLYLARPMVKGIVGQESQLQKLYHIQSRVFISKKQLDSALISIYEARQLATQLSDLAGKTATYISSGEIFQQKGNYKAAIREYSEGFINARQIDAISLQVLMAEPLYKLYQQKGNADSSKRYFDIFTALKAQTKEIEAKEQLMRNELMREYKMMEAAVKQKAGSDKRVYLLTALVALTFGFMGFGGTLAYRRRYRRLELEKVRKELEAQRMELGRLRLEAQVTQQEQQLAEYQYKISKNMMLESLIQDLQQYITKGAQLEKTKNITPDNLNTIQQGKIWEEFEIRFLKTHIGFYDRLLNAHPNLTPNERRLCSFLRMDMTTKEISVITGQTIRAVEIARTRLRKKLSLIDSDKSLFDYLCSI